MNKISLGFITPVFNEENNLRILAKRISDTISTIGLSPHEWEWIVVDDHSTDSTSKIVQELRAAHPQIKYYRFSKNFGSHAAIRCGLKKISAAAAVVLAADLQDPPEFTPTLLAEWKKGALVVWAYREEREGQGFFEKVFSRLYHRMIRSVLGLKNVPPAGADFFLIDKAVVRAINQFEENNVSILALISWLGFRQTSVPYKKAERVAGRSGWTFRKKIKLVMDSMISFSLFPMRLVTITGFLVALFGFALAVNVFYEAIAGSPPTGYASLMLATLMLSGVILIGQGILGEYLWRTLDESRRRPIFIIEEEHED